MASQLIKDLIKWDLIVMRPLDPQIKLGKYTKKLIGFATALEADRRFKLDQRIVRTQNDENLQFRNKLARISFTNRWTSLY